MAVALDQANVCRWAATTTASTSANTLSAVASGALIVVVAFKFQSAAPTAAFTFSGGGLSWSISPTSPVSGNIKAALGYAFAPAGLALGTSLTVGVASSTADITAVASSYTGVDTTTPLDSAGGTSGAVAGWTTNAITGTDVGDAVIGGAGSDGSLLSSLVAGDNNERQDFSSGTTSGSVTLYDDLVAEVNDTVAGTWSTGQAWVSVGAAFNDAAAAVDNTTKPGLPGLFTPQLVDGMWF